MQKLHLNQGPQEVADANETTPSAAEEAFLETEALTAELQDLGAEVATAAEAYTGDNAQSLVDHLAAASGQVWQGFEGAPCSPLTALIMWLIKSLADWPSELKSLIAERAKILGTAKDALTDQIKAAIRRELKGEKLPEPKQSRSQLALKEAEDALRKLRISVTGEPEGRIDRKNRKAVFIAGGAFALVMGFAEFLMGYDINRGLGTEEGAFGQSLAIVLGVIVLSLITAINVSLILGYLTARQNYRRMFNDNFKGLRGLPIKTWVMGITGLTLLLTCVVALVGWRESVAASSELLKGSQGIAYVISAVILIMFGFKVWLSPMHDSDFLAEEKTLLAAVSAAKAEVTAEQQLKDNQPQVPQEPIAAAIFTYKAKVEEAETLLKDAVLTMRQGIARYAQLLACYKNAQQQVLNTYQDLVGELFRQLNLTEGNRPKNADIMNVGRNECTLTLLNPEADAAISNFNPVYETGDVVVEFDQLITELRREVQTELVDEAAGERQRAQQAADLLQQDKVARANARLLRPKKTRFQETGE